MEHKNLTMGFPQRLWILQRINAGISVRDSLESFFIIQCGRPFGGGTPGPNAAVAVRVRQSSGGRDKETLGFPLGSRDRGIRGISLGLYKVPQRWLGTLELRGVLGGATMTSLASLA